MRPLLFLLLASAPATDGGQPDPAEARARAALAPFKQTLKETLTRALATSPEAAIEVCAAQAPELAKEASRGGVTVGRSALRLRNPANAGPAWLRPLVEELSHAPPGTPASRTVHLKDGRVGYAEAIWMAEPCLLCHGEAVTPAIGAKLKQRYPSDAARGFKAGDFRGVFWAELSP